MRKNYKSALALSKKQQYNKIMRKVGSAVRNILESAELDDDEDVDECGIRECDDDYDGDGLSDFEECDKIDTDECDKYDMDECDESYDFRNMFRRRHHLNEMARAAVNRAVDPKAYANVRDAASRRGYDVEWAKNVRPLKKFDAVQLLHRYVSALLIFGADCPKTEADIDRIGIFANYAHALIDSGEGTLNDIQTLYAKNDKVAARKRSGSTRRVKGYYSDVQSKPSENFNFDDENSDNQEDTDEVTDVPADNVPADDDTVDDTDTEDLENTDTDDTDNTEDVDTDDDDDYNDPLADDDDIPSYDEVGDDEDSDSDIIDIDNINNLTNEDFYNPKMNKSFVNFNDDYILSKGNQIGFKYVISNTNDDNDTAEGYIFRDSFGEALEELYIILNGDLMNVNVDVFFEIKVSPVINKFFRVFSNIITNEQFDAADEAAESVGLKVFATAENAQSVVDAINDIDFSNIEDED